MNYGRFLLLRRARGHGLGSIFVLGGYLLGSMPWFKDNFIMVVLAIIIISVLPMVDRVGPGAVLAAEGLKAVGSEECPGRWCSAS